MESINLTNTLAGLAAIQRAMAGEDILFTKLEIGDGVLTNTDVSGMTGLVNKTKEYVLGAVKAEDSEIVRLRSNISNAGVTQDLIIREYGIYAKFGNEQEFLFAYLNVGDLTTPLPNQTIGRYELNRDFVLYIGNSTHVDFTSNGNLVYVAVNQYKNDMSKKGNVESTVENMKKSNYENGDIVELLGYMYEGDTSSEKRIIATENDEGILLENGLYANLVDKSKRFYGKKICLIGDSITALPEADFWKNKIKSWFGFSDLISLAVSGSTITTGNQDRGTFHTQVDSIPIADVYLVWGGVNDFVANAEIGNIKSLSTDTVYGSVKSIINKIQVKNIGAEIFFFTPLPQFWNGASGADTNPKGYCLMDYSEAIQQVCSMFSVPVLDLTSSSGINKYNHTLYLKDGVHPNRKGYEKIIPLFYEFFRLPITNLTKKSFTLSKSGDTQKTIIADKKDGENPYSEVMSMAYDKLTKTLGLYLGQHKDPDIDRVGIAAYLKGIYQLLWFTEEGLFLGTEKVCTESIQGSGNNRVIKLGSLKIQVGQTFINTATTNIPIEPVTQVLFANVVPVRPEGNGVTHNVKIATNTTFHAFASENNVACFYIHVGI
ncbi:MAG: SGNH/GDSL hydrolase family protein [Cetobacterium sp.]|uniref:SGNH/GDSL hydrolase family protein n=1 Tax=Cetobacterium sp. TaxID=2071632 RepID=UPI003F38C9D0